MTCADVVSVMDKSIKKLSVKAGRSATKSYFKININMRL